MEQAHADGLGRVLDFSDRLRTHANEEDEAQSHGWEIQEQAWEEEDARNTQANDKAANAANGYHHTHTTTVNSPPQRSIIISNNLTGAQPNAQVPQPLNNVHSGTYLTFAGNDMPVTSPGNDMPVTSPYVTFYPSTVRASVEYVLYCSISPTNHLSCLQSRICWPVNGHHLTLESQ